MKPTLLTLLTFSILTGIFLGLQMFGYMAVCWLILTIAMSRMIILSKRY